VSETRHQPPEWLTRAEAAAVARVSQKTIDRAIASGSLRATKVNGRRVRIHRSWLTAWLLGAALLICSLYHSERVDRWCQTVKQGRYGARLAKLAALVFSTLLLLFMLGNVASWDPAEHVMRNLGISWGPGVDTDHDGVIGNDHDGDHDPTSDVGQATDRDPRHP